MMQRKITGTHIIEKNDVVMISRKESRRSLPGPKYVMRATISDAR